LEDWSYQRSTDGITRLRVGFIILSHGRWSKK
jgi:hypothetical protein